MIEVRIVDVCLDGLLWMIVDLERYASDAYGSALTFAFDACGVRNVDVDYVVSYLG